MKKDNVRVTTALAIMLLGSAVTSQAATLVYCSEGSPENFSPALVFTATTADAGRPVFDQLVLFNRGQTTVKPGLAESWTISPDGRQVTFHLRKGVKFHSGVNGFTPTRDFNADDVSFSFNRQWKKEHPYHGTSGGSYEYFNGMEMGTIIRSIDRVDDNTVKFTLNEPNAPFIADMAMDFASIYSAEYGQYLLDKGKPDEIDRIPVGTGPFVFESYQKDSVVRYKAFDDYWQGRAAIDDLVFAITPDATARYAKLKAGECHVMSNPNPIDLPEMNKDPELSVLSVAGLNVGYLAFNTKRPPFDNVEARRALSMAIDRDSILHEVFGASGELAKNFIPPAIWAADSSTPAYVFDPERAKTALAKVANGAPLEIDLWYMPVQRPYNPNAKRVAEMMQADLAAVGVNARLITYEWGEYRKRLQNGEHLLGQLGWIGDNGDPDNFFFLMSCAGAAPGGGNIAKWCDPEFDKRLVAARTTIDQKERVRLYSEMQAIMRDQVPVLPLAHSTVYEPVRKEISNYLISPFGRREFYGVSLK